MLLSPAFLWAGEMYTFETVDRVISGDTFKLESGKKVRLIGVDAPENEVNRKAREDSKRTGQDLDEIIEMGKTTTEWIKPRLEGKKIFLKYDKKKKDDRGAEWAYAYLYDVSGFYGGIVVRHLYDDVQDEWWELPERGSFIFINATIIKGGYATPVRNPPNVKYADLFEKSYWEGQEANEGLGNVNYFEVPCTKEGEKIGACAGCIIRCCKGSMPIFDQMVDGKCRERPVPGSGGYCSHCGNNKCEAKQFEDSCNCPEDCK
jgi:endonuclease YncB( thermonuclease family)